MSPFSVTRLPTRLSALLLALVPLAPASAQDVALELGGDRQVGGEVLVRIDGPAGAHVQLLLSRSVRETALATAAGDLWIDTPWRRVDVGVLPPGGTTVPVPVPAGADLVGELLYVQALALPGGLSPLARTSLVAPGTDPPKVFRVLVLNYDPVLESQGGVRLHEYAGWQDPRELADAYIRDVRAKSGGFVDQVIVEWQDRDEWPDKLDGFRYTDATYLDALATGNWHMPDRLHYSRLVNRNGLAERVSRGDFDEVFLFGAPYFGYFESRMAGPNAYWVNSPGMPWVPSTRKFILMGFNYERGVAEMLHDVGHRIESILTHVYGSWNPAMPPQHDWDRFSRYDLIDPGNAAIGNTHFPCNGAADYDYGNPNPVPSTADDWLENWPNLTGATRMIDASEWGATHRGYMRWFFDHLPRREGTASDGRELNWWKYVYDFNAYPHSQ